MPLGWTNKHYTISESLPRPWRRTKGLFYCGRKLGPGRNGRIGPPPARFFPGAIWLLFSGGPWATRAKSDGHAPSRRRGELSPRAAAHRRGKYERTTGAPLDHIGPFARKTRRFEGAWRKNGLCRARPSKRQNFARGIVPAQPADTQIFFSLYDSRWKIGVEAEIFRQGPNLPSQFPVAMPNGGSAQKRGRD